MQHITANRSSNGSKFTCILMLANVANIVFVASIIRILFMVPVYSLVAWLSIFFYRDSVYFEVLGDCYEAFCISAFFSLMCHYIAPDLHSQKDYFRGIQPKVWLWPLTWMKKCCGGERVWRTPRSGLTWFNVRGNLMTCHGNFRRTNPCIGCLGWSFPILLHACSHDHCCCCYPGLWGILRGVPQSRIFAYLGKTASNLQFSPL